MLCNAYQQMVFFDSCRRRYQHADAVRIRVTQGFRQFLQRIFPVDITPLIIFRNLTEDFLISKGFYCYVANIGIFMVFCEVSEGLLIG